MGMFAEIAIVDYRLSVNDQGKRTSVFHFWLVINSSCRFHFQYIRVLERQHTVYIYTYEKWNYIYTYAAVSNRKWKTEVRRCLVTCIPFTHHANGSFSYIRLLTKKQMKVFCLQTGLPICANLQYLKTLLDNLELLNTSE
jgi:hypothetical protein